MRTGLLVSLIAIAMVMASAPVTLFSDGADAKFDIDDRIDPDATVTFKGFVRFNIQPEVNELPHLVVLIVETMPEGNFYITEPYTTTINKDGSFSIEVPRIIMVGVSYYFLVKSGYEIDIIQSEWFDNKPEDITAYSGADIDHKKYPLTYTDAYCLTKAPEIKNPPAEDSLEWYVTGGSDERNVIGVIRIAGTFEAVVSHGNYNLSNVEISLIREDSMGVSNGLADKTDSNGVCTIYDVPTGTYRVVATLEDYEQAEEVTVTINKNTKSSIAIEMDMISSDKDYFGFDLPHFLMICGGGIGIMVLIISAIVQHRAIKGKGPNWIFNDFDDEED